MASRDDFSCGGQSTQSDLSISFFRPYATCTARSTESEVVASITPDCKGSDESGVAYIHIAASDWQVESEQCREYELEVEVLADK